MPYNKRNIGTEYEKLAEEYLVKNGVRILEKNFRSRFGEIDLIGYDREYLVFFEVKYRGKFKETENNLQSGGLLPRKTRRFGFCSDEI